MQTVVLIEKALSGFQGDARLYWIVGTEDYIVVSGVFGLYVPETYIFSSDRNGAILSWDELPGSFQGSVDHERALREGGYDLIDPPDIIEGEAVIIAGELKTDRDRQRRIEK